MNYKIFLIENKESYSRTEKYYYMAVAYDNDNDTSIVYIYPHSEETKYSSKTKPEDFGFMIGHELKDINKKYFTNTYSSKYYIVKEVGTNPNDFNLVIPKQYHCDSINFTVKKGDGVSDETVKKIKKVESNLKPFIIIDEDFSKRKAKDHYYGSDINEYFCTKCNTRFFNEDSAHRGSYGRICCPNCSTECYNRDLLVFKDFKKAREQEYKCRYYGPVFKNTSSKTKECFYFLSKHPEHEDGIAVYKIKHEINAEKNPITESYEIEYMIEHVVGKSLKCYKYLKRGKKECDAFEALNINSKNILSTIPMIYDNSVDFLEFASNNEKFLRMSGFQTLLKYAPDTLNIEPFFIIFIGILNRYPIMEQIVKMGHARLYFDLYNQMLASTNKVQIDETVAKLSDLVDTESSGGKTALRFPSYIGDYLIKKNANLSEYYYWRDIYEITKISKEQFEKLTDSFNYAWVNSQANIEDIGNILKFGYKIDKLINYIVKQSRKHKLNIDLVITYLKDYLNMCDILGVKPDEYAQDIKKVHDDISIHYSKHLTAAADKILLDIALECEEYVLPKEEELGAVGIPKLFEKLTVVFPRSEKDFINEGNMQHNCVGSYPNRVRRGDCVIFFIRYKDQPYKSFITAECTHSGLGQCFYSNNRYVNDQDLINFAKYIAKKITTGCKSGAINALKKY